MNLVLITKILQQQNPSIGFNLRMRRTTPQRVGTRLDVRFIMFCFAFLNTGGPDTFWRWIERERHIPRSLRDEILSYRAPETINCHSLEFLDLLGNWSFVSIMRDLVTLIYRTSNLGQFINASFSWSEQPEGHTFWATLNSRIDNLYRFFRNQPHSQDMPFPDLSIGEMRQLVINAIGILWERNALDGFAIDYATLENERNQQEFGRVRLTTAFGESVLSRQTVDEILDSLPDFEWQTYSTSATTAGSGTRYSYLDITAVSADNHT